MRLPTIPQRHRRLARTVAIVGTTALALVRRRDFAPEHERTLRFGTAVADAGLTWITGSKAFADVPDDPGVVAEMFGAFESEAGAPVRYRSSQDEPSSSSEAPGRDDASGDADSWWDEHAGMRSQSLSSAATAVVAGAVSWALWPLTQKVVEAVDSKLPAGVGRGLSAGVGCGIVVLSAVLADKLDEWISGDGEVSYYAPVEIELPAHIRDAVDLLLSQPHPVAADTAEVVREQFDSAQFFVWISYPETLHSGSDPVVLDSAGLAQLLEEDVSWIEVYPSASSPTVVPARQTYPVTGVCERGSSSQLQFSLEIIDGRLKRLDLSDPGEDETEEVLTAEVLSDSVPGTLHPEGLESEAGQAGYWSNLTITDCEDEEEPLTLDRWPRPEDLSVRVDGE